MECQKVKAKNIHPTGLLQPLSIFEWKWEVVTMDFIMRLLLAGSGIYFLSNET
jgi:hypothetical protein